MFKIHTCYRLDKYPSTSERCLKTMFKHILPTDKVMQHYNPETYTIEYPILCKKSNARLWTARIRLIKKFSKCSHTNVDWNMMQEIQVPIPIHLNITDDIISQYWTETGMIDGKHTRTIPTYPEPKNLNKKNYRNSLQQAICEVDTKFKKKLEEGFEMVDSDSGKSDLRIFPMLAKPYESKKLAYPVYCQPKLDGLRCVCFKDLSGAIVMQSRTRKDFPSNHLNNAIRSKVEIILKELPNGTYLDGELYTHSSKLQLINHYARDGDLSSDSESSLQYHIYDVIPNFTMKFEHRLLILNSLKKFECSVIQVVSTELIQTQQQLDLYYTHAIQSDYEGIMIRDPTKEYLKKRSDGLLKRKEVYTAEYPIVGYTCGVKGKDMNAVIWICQTVNDDTFKVTPNWTYEERYQTYKLCLTKFDEKYKNRLLMVEYRALSIDQVPQHGKGVCIRDVE